MSLDDSVADRDLHLTAGGAAREPGAEPDQGACAPHGDDWRVPMQRLYDAYFASHDYERRYPRPNEGTLEFLWRHGAHRAAQVLDVGCGAGRYAMPVLQRGAGRLVGCDISRQAIERFGARLPELADPSRVRLVVGGVDAVPEPLRFDCALMLFGVLSHVGPRAARLRLLRELRRRMEPKGALLLSVPSIWRRRPREVLRSLSSGGARGDIEFTRQVAGMPRTFLYHLYSFAGLRQELADAGWRLEAAEAEGLLPEWLLAQHPGLGRLDARLQRLLPPALGYGIRVLARPEA